MKDASRAAVTSYLVPDLSSSLRPNTYPRYAYKEEAVAVLEIGVFAARPSNTRKDASRAAVISYLVPDSWSSLRPNTYPRYAYKKGSVAVLESNLEYTHSY